MNTKGQIFSVMMVIMTLMVLGLGYMNYLGSTTEEKIGSKQTDLLDAYQKSRQTLLNLDTITKFSGIDAIYSLAKNGGFSSNPPCGDYYGIPLWSYKNPEEEYAECIPSPTEQIIEPFSQNFNEVLPDEDDFSNNYEFFSYQNKTLHITAFATQKKYHIIGETHPPKHIRERIYSYTPSVNKKFDYNLSTYDKIKSFLDYLNKKCSSKENSEESNALTKCVEKNTNEFSEQNNISLSTLRPNNLPTKTFSGESFKENLNSIEETTYTDCYKPSTTHPIKDDNIYELRNMKDRVNSLFGDSIFNILFYVGETKEQPKVASQDDIINYLPTTDKINPKKQNKKFNLLYKKNENEALLLEEKPKDHYKQCSHEKRKFLFEINLPPLYPTKGNLTYRFALYVNDSAKPEFRDLNVRDKEFDQNNLLVTWKHTDSRDLKNYTINVNGESRKKVKLWEDVLIRPSIDWEGGNGKPFNTCTLEDHEGHKECFYSEDQQETFFKDNKISGPSKFSMKERKVYYFVDNNQFVYVLPNIENSQTYQIKVTAFDDDLNNYSLTSQGKSIDDLPLMPLEEKAYKISPVCEPQTQMYESVMTTHFGPVLKNMDGSEAKDFQQDYVFFETYNKNTVSTNQGKQVLAPGIVSLLNPHHISDGSSYLLVPKDPSLKNIDKLYFDTMGYETQTPKTCWSK